jgi:hypothetical protein
MIVSLPLLENVCKQRRALHFVRTPKVEKKVVKVSQNAESGGKVGILYFA